jgi:hypothetical protein
MPYASREARLAAMRRYAQTPAGIAAKRRSHQRYIEKRRQQREALHINAQPLAQVIEHWRRT